MAPQQSNEVQLPYLETFAKAAELSSFTAAAKVLQLTQAAVSQRVQALEKTLGVSLFRRHGGRVLVTDAGRNLYDYAQRILELHRQAYRRIRGRDLPVTGELALAASSIPGEHFLPALLLAFHQKHPHIQVRASISDSMTVMAQVERGLTQLGLVGRTIDHPHLTFRLFSHDRMVVVVPPGHALRKRRNLSLADVCRHSFILREPGSGIRHCFEKALEQAGLSPRRLHIALELGSNQAVKEAVLRGAGVAVLSDRAVQRELKTGRLRAVPVKDLVSEREIYVVQDRRRVASLPTRQFLTFLESHPASGSTP